MLGILIYWGLIIYFSLLVISKIQLIIRTRQSKDIRIWKYIFDTLRFGPLFILIFILSFVMRVSNFTVVRLLFPLFYGFSLFILLAFLINLLDYYPNIVGIKYTYDALGYLTITTWTILYAHTPIFKKAYIVFLVALKKIWSTLYTDEYIDNERIKVNQNLFSIHIYILLLIVYIIYNTFGFLGVFEKEQISYVTEALLTFVIIDTIINGRKWKDTLS